MTNSLYGHFDLIFLFYIMICSIQMNYIHYGIKHVENESNYVVIYISIIPLSTSWSNLAKVILQ